MSIKETKTIKLDNCVVVRKVAMTSEGCDNLRAIRQYFIDMYAYECGEEVNLPFPTVVHLLMEKFCQDNNLS